MFIRLFSSALWKEGMLGLVMQVQQCFTDGFSELTFLVLVTIAGILVNCSLIYLQALHVPLVFGKERGCQSFTEVALHAGLWNHLCPPSYLFNDYFKLVSTQFVSMISWLTFICISLLLYQILFFLFLFFIL